MVYLFNPSDKFSDPLTCATDVLTSVCAFILTFVTSLLTVHVNVFKFTCFNLHSSTSNFFNFVFPFPSRTTLNVYCCCVPSSAITVVTYVVLIPTCTLSGSVVFLAVAALLVT